MSNLTQIDLSLQSKDGSLTGEKIRNNAITNAKIDPAANIAISKLDTSGAAFDSNGLLKAGSVGTNALSDSSVTNAKIADGAITDSKVSASAQIAISKLNTDSASFDSNGLLKAGSVGANEIAAGSISNSHISATAAIAYSKLNIADGDLTIAKTNGLQAALDSKLSLSGGTMQGNILMNGYAIKNLATPTEALDAVTKAYVDNLVSGISWKEPVNDVVSSLPGSPNVGDRYLLNSGSNVNKIAEWNGASWDYFTPSANWAVFVKNGDYAMTYDSESTETFKWIQFTGAGQINAGVGLSKTGNTLDVKLGAGITELPTDEVGIDLATNSGLELTSLDSSGQLKVKVDGVTLTINGSGALEVIKSAVGDNLGNHTAAQDLNMSGYSITNAKTISGSASKYSLSDSTSNGILLLKNASDSSIISLNATTGVGSYIATPLGVNTSTPNTSYALDVNGSINVSGQVLVNGVSIWEKQVRERFVADGTTASFTLSGTPLSNREILVYLDGLLMWEGTTDDYTYNSNNKTITFTFTPQSNSRIQVVYTASV